jgi:hypothetical protein
VKTGQATYSSGLLQQSPVLICVIAALIVLIGVLAIVTTAPPAPKELELGFGEIPG